MDEPISIAKRQLYVCSCNLNRSPTCCKYISDKYLDLDVRSAGTLYGYPYIVNKDILDWADEIYVMESEHRNYITKKFGREYLNKIIILNIEDIYDPHQPELISEIKRLIVSGKIRISISN